MRRIIRLLFPLVFAGTLCFGQNTTTLTGTIIDSDSQTWNNAAWSATLVVPGDPSGHATFTDGTPVPQSYSGILTSGGTFTIATVGNTAKILPTGVLWKFTICTVSSAPCQTFTLSVSGSTVDMGARLSSLVSPLRIQAALTNYAYSATEIINPVNGTGYVRTTDATGWMYNGVTYIRFSGVSVTGGSGNVATIPKFASDSSIQDSSLSDDGVQVLTVEPFNSHNLNTDSANSTVLRTLPCSMMGDSITVGYYADNSGPPFADAYTNVLKTAKGWTNCTNDAVSGSAMMDSNIAALAFENTIPIGGGFTTLMIGSNDMRSTFCDGCTTGMSTTAAQAEWQSGLAAVAAWRSIPQGDYQRTGQQCSTTGPIRCTFTGTWTNSPAYGGTVALQSINAGDTITVSFSGSTFYFFGLNQYHNTASYSLTIDGVPLPTATAGIVTENGTISRTILDAGATYAPQLIRFSGLTSINHTLVLTSLSADVNNPVYFVGFATPQAVSKSGPYLYLANTPRAQSAGYVSFGGSDTIVSQFDQMESEIVSKLASDGLNIVLVDVASILDPNAACNLFYTDSFHPNGAGNSSCGAGISGHEYISSAFVNASTNFNLPSDRGQSRILSNLNICTRMQSFAIGGCPVGIQRGDIGAAEFQTVGKLFLGLDGKGLSRAGNVYTIDGTSVKIGANDLCQSDGTGCLPSNQTLYTFSATPSALTAQTCGFTNVTVTGVLATDHFTQVTPPSYPTSLTFPQAYAQTNTITLQYCNPTTTTQTPPAGTYSLVGFR